jgi:hypothetical protein
LHGDYICTVSGPSRAIWVLFSACLAGCGLACCSLAGCGGGGGNAADLAPIRLLHDPAIGRLTAEQLRSLSMDCERYPANGSMRGRYDAAYCEEAMAAWADSPLQMVTIPPPAAPGADSGR